MKSILSLIAAGALIGMLMNASMGQAQVKPAPGPSGKPHSFEASFTPYHIAYREDVTPPLKSTESGWLPGFGLAYGYKEKKNGSPAPYARLALGLTVANTHYDGSDQLGNPLLGTTRNVFVRGEGNLGLTLFSTLNPPRGPGDFTAYTGLGYRFWERGLGSDTSGYREHYSWRYVPVGMRVGYRVNEKWSGAVDASARFMFGGTILVYLSDLDPGYNDPRMSLGSRPGWRVEAPVYYRFWSFTPWFEYSAIGRSNSEEVTYYGRPLNPRIAVYEPSSTTYQVGLAVGARVSF
jgi:hypothetical protein